MPHALGVAALLDLLPDRIALEGKVKGMKPGRDQESLLLELFLRRTYQGERVRHLAWALNASEGFVYSAVERGRIVFERNNLDDLRRMLLDRQPLPIHTS